ncbi:MAG TPA: SulP family inorganic anion transporter, partial [Novosphingobium sp.]|nr:SulP family inorganic anion transporter [Novosphingobium sp.]
MIRQDGKPPLAALGRLGHEGLVGLGLAGLMLPEGVAYAGIAGLPPGRALAAGVAGGLIYALAGRSRFAVISPTSSSAAILAAAIASLGASGAPPAALATALVAMVGLVFAGLALFRLGSLAGFVSRPVLHGFAFGLACTIIIKQWPAIVGVKSAGGPVWRVAGGLIAAAPAWNIASLALGAGALAALIALRRLPQVPGALVVMAGGIALAQGADLAGHGVALAGPVVLAEPVLSLPPLALVPRLAQLAAPIALILFAESWGTMRSLALPTGDRLSANRELGALGAANLASALAMGMPVGAGFSAGAANAAAGATSRWSAATAALALLALALWAGPLIARIPEPVLAAVVIAALTHALSPAPFLRLWRIRRDHWIALAAAIGVLALGVLNGMLAAIALSIAHLLYDLAHPSISELGEVGDSRDFVDIARHPEAARVANVAIFRPNAPLIFANAEATLNAIAARAHATTAGVVVLSLEETANLDATALDALVEFAQSFAAGRRQVILARAHDLVREVLLAAGRADLARNCT